jgi:hypothetical protein
MKRESGDRWTRRDQGEQSSELDAGGEVFSPPPSWHDPDHRSHVAVVDPALAPPPILFVEGLSFLPFRPLFVPPPSFAAESSLLTQARRE